MNKNKIILSFPYSGALYYFVDKTLLGGRYSGWPSGYYTWLFGKKPDRWVSMALTFTVLYPEIILPMRDHPLPKLIDNEIKPTDRDPDLGIIVDWDDFSVRSILLEKAKEDTHDPNIWNMLNKMKIPPISRVNLLYDIRYELYLSQKHKARIVCAKGRKRIVDYLLQRDLARSQQETATRPEIQFLEKYVQVSGLEYNMDKLEDLYAIKEDEEVKKYATSFRERLHSLPNMEHDESAIIFSKLVEEALESSANARKYSKPFSRTAKFVSWTTLLLGMVLPGISTIGTGIEKGLDTVADKSEKDTLRHEWYDLAPRISSARSRSQLLRSVKELKRQNKK